MRAGTRSVLLMGLLNSRSAMHSFECMQEEGRKEGRKEGNEINYACCYSNRSQLLSKFEGGRRLRERAGRRKNKGRNEKGNNKNEEKMNM